MKASNNRVIKVNQSRMDYRCRSFGSYEGEPTVSMNLSKSDDFDTKVGSLLSVMDNYGWVNDLESGNARLFVHGTQPFHEMHEEGLSGLENSLNARFFDFGVTDLQTEPPRRIKRLADHFVVFVPRNFDFDRDVMESFAEQSRKFGDVDFVFDLKKVTDDEYVNEISKEYKLYNSDIYIRPTGRKLHTTADRASFCEKMCKKNGWTMNGRIDLLTDYEEDEGE